MKSCPTCKALYPADYGVCPKDGAVLRPVTELEEGAVLRGKYQVLALLGRGGMGAVYKAKHLAFNELCALKVVKSALLEEPEFLKRFRAEAVTMRRLRHPHAVQVHDLDETEDGRPFIVMEYVEGQSLDRALAEDGPLDSARAVAIAAQVGSALATAHQLGIIHRDIKPSNILLARAPDSAEAAKVLDFGVAKVKEQATLSYRVSSLTGTGMVVGTPAYMSPEQARGTPGEQLDGRSDLYSLGVVLYEMLTGKPPFTAETPVQLLLAHVQQAPPDPRTLRPDLPASLVELVLRALEKEPDKRFPSAEALLKALEAVSAQQTLPIISLPAALEEAPPPPATLPLTAAHPSPPGAKLVAVPPPPAAEPAPPPPSAVPAAPRPQAAPAPAKPAPRPAPKTPAWVYPAAAAVALALIFFVWQLSRTRPESGQPGVVTPTTATEGTTPSIEQQTGGTKGDPKVLQKAKVVLFLVQNVDAAFDMSLSREVIDSRMVDAHTELDQFSKTPDAEKVPTLLASLRLALGFYRRALQVNDAFPRKQAKAALRQAEQLLQNYENSGNEQARKVLSESEVKGASMRPATDAARERQRRQAESNEEAILNLMQQGRQALDAGRYDDAIRTFEEVLKLEPNHRAAPLGLERARRAQAAEREVLRRRRE